MSSVYSGINNEFSKKVTIQADLWSDKAGSILERLKDVPTESQR